jgi:group I intron endonuclease
MREKLCGVYLIVCDANGRLYVGSSVDIHNRWWNHKSQLKHNKHDNKHLQRAWNKYGAPQFRLKILKQCQRDELLCLEQVFIDKFRAYTEGFNGSPVASHPVHDSESKQQIRERMLKQWQDPDYKAQNTARLRTMNAARQKPRRSPEEHRRQAKEACKKGTQAYLQHRQDDPAWAKGIDEKRAKSSTGVKKVYTPETLKRVQENGKRHAGNLTRKERK